MPTQDNVTTRREFLRTVAGGTACFAAGGRLVFGGEAPAADLAFGVMADCQYLDADPRGVRHYRASLKKLEAAVAHLNTMDLAFVIHLGDFIDGDFDSFDAVGPIYAKLKMPKYHALGNHDFAVAAEKKAEVPSRMGMPARYYDFAVKGWRFIVLDGNDISMISRSSGSDEYQQAQAMCKELKQRKAPNAYSWNGAVGSKQMSWLKERLATATKAGEKAVTFCHFPVFPANAHNLWNDLEVIKTIESYDCVVAYMNGHNHAGNYGVKNGVHYVTVAGMVDTPDANAYGCVEAKRKGLKLVGQGRVASREMAI